MTRESTHQQEGKPSFNLPREEEAILKRWERAGTFAKSVEQRDPANRFVFFEGPPTANGKPGIHHVLGRSFKDAIPRYQTMRGRRVERKAGWDTHGLAVEIEVEKQLGVSGKPQIENLVPGDVTASIAKFNELCRESVWTYKDEWERLTKRMGFWLDLDHPYITYEREYIESLWWVLKQIWDRELLYEDFKVVPYCPRCGTALSSHEVAQGYDEATDTSVVVKFPVKGEADTYLLAWTTTPWTLPGNVALAVGSNISYGRYRDAESGETYILADDRQGIVFGNREFERSDITLDELTALSYVPLFDITPLQSEKSHRVYAANFVSTEEGTGLVHTAVMYGEDDFRLGTDVGLPKHHTVDGEGRFTNDVPQFVGRFVKDPKTEQAIVADLATRGLLLKEELYTHTYPFCWRCKTPLLYYAKRSWFIRMSQFRDKLIKRNDTVTWVPEHLKDGRFGEWLREVKDWALSRDRYWGTPLPIWHCAGCDHKLCIGSLRELEQLSGQSAPEDPHRPYIDDVRWKCTQCSTGMMERYPEVIDVWFDSGAMPLAQWHYPHAEGSEKELDTHYPADYIAEGLDQTRGWFYTLLAVAAALGRPAPYKAVISHGLVLDAQGKKMSKSVGNVVSPWEAIEQFGVDPIRLYFYSVNQPSEDKRFDPADIEQVVRKFFLILWNVYRFLADRGGAPVPRGVEGTAQPGSDHVLDQWLVARGNQATARGTEAFDELDLFRASRELMAWTNELSTWYLRLSRKREDAEFLPTLAWALKRTALLAAPLVPFFAELLWDKLRSTTDPESVHLADWPEATAVDEDILNAMAQVQQAVELGRAARAEAKIKVRQPLARATVTGLVLTAELSQLLADELNVKTVEQAKGSALAVELDTTLTDSLRAEGLARDVVRSIQQLRKQAALEPGSKAGVSIAGTHALQGELTQLTSVIEKQTNTKLTWGEGEGEHRLEVDGLTISLSL